MKTTTFFITLFFIFLSADELNDNILYKTMRDELNRNITNLKIAKQVKPYYISYRVEDAEFIEVKAEFGGLLYSNRSRSRDTYVDLRVGTYRLDNSNFICQTRSSYIIESDHTTLPLEDDYEAIRNALWIVTDGTYKKALEKLSRKRASIQNRPQKDDIPDFSKVSVCNKIEPIVELDINKKEWETKVTQISKIFQKYPAINKSDVKFYAKSSNQHFLDTGGNQSRRADLLSYIEVTAKAQAEDGDPIENHLGFYCHTPDQLPEISAIISVVQAMAETLSLMTRLEKEEDYSGPVLFINQAAAELIFQVLGKGISDPKSPLYENEMLARTAGKKDMGMLINRLGRRVMPDFLSACDDPNLIEWNDEPLVGHFSIDDQGVYAQRTDVVKNGKLTGILMSRAPIKKAKTSNGHARYRNERHGARTCGMVGNLIIKSSEPRNPDELYDVLINICKDYEIPYGIIITRLNTTQPLTLKDRYMRYFTSMSSPAEKPILSYPIIAYKVDAATGEIELIRGLDFSSVTTRVLRDIVATGDKEFVYNFLYHDAEGNEYPMSVVAPAALLVEEMELVTKETKPEKLPLLSHPYFKKRMN